jgi:aminotransferase
MSDPTPWTGRTSALVFPPIAEVNRLAAEAQASGVDVISLGQALLGLPPPDAAMQAVSRYLAEGGCQGYSPDPGLPALREAIADHLRRRKGVAAATAASVLVTCGANQAFLNTILAITRPGDEVVTFGPGYFDHDFAITLAGCQQVEVGLRVETGRFRFDPAAAGAAITPRTRVVVVVSPGNPTGAVADHETLLALHALCRRHGLWLVSDETYDLLTFDPVKHVSAASLPDADRVVVLGSFSKVFALAGWRLGYLHGAPDLVSEALKVQDAAVVCAPVASQHAALGALADADAFVARARTELTARRNALLDALADWGGVEPVAPDGSTFLMARLPAGSDDVALAFDLVRRAGVATVPGTAFGPRGAGWLRFSFGNQPPDRIREAVERIRIACDGRSAS